MSFTTKQIQAIALKPSKWTPTYSFTKRTYNQTLQRDAQARQLLRHYFQHFLYSTPRIEHSASGTVRLRIYIHENRELKPNDVPASAYDLGKFRSFLQTVYGRGKKVELDVQPLSAPYLNAEIAAQYLALSSKKRAFGSLTQRFMKQTPLGSAVEGVKLQVSGRLGRRKGAGRSSRVTRQKGKLGFASFTSRVEAARCEFKNRNGKIGVVVWIRSGKSLVPDPKASESRMREFVQRWKDRRIADPTATDSARKAIEDVQTA